MALIVSRSDQQKWAITAGWQTAVTVASELATPAELTAITNWIPAIVPGTVALAQQRAGRWNINAPTPLHDSDHWYRVQFPASGTQVLHFAGLATLAEVWLNGVLILRSDNMFHAHDVEVALQGDNELCICFRALTALLAKPVKRARWRPTMIVPATLRAVRTTLLGHMPGWCPAVHAVGPWRVIELHALSTSLTIERTQLHAQLQNQHTGVLQVALVLKTPLQSLDVVLECAGQRIAMQLDVDGTLRAELVLNDIHAWWPHTHGVPHLYQVKLLAGAVEIDLGKVGFRRIAVDRGEDGRSFALIINGVRVFCRGACWTSADIIGLAGTRQAYTAWLQQMRIANMNMVRVGGTMVYEADAFYALCDELGIMVWQDFMFANFDYPVADTAFAASVKREATQFLDRTQCSPSITVLCGGSEVAQQASMLGLPADAWTGPLFAEWLPTLCTQLRPDVPYVANSPCGGDLPFIANAGVTHYYGVGAYLRPLNDARRTAVKFASECLAFANVPEAITLQRELPIAAVHHPLWKQRVPRDQGASWDFEDIRDHYLELLYKVDPPLLRRTDAERYLTLSRAVSGEVMAAVFAEWRRPASPCAGGLVWTYQDLLPGAGWGIVDSTGEPKAAWYALRRAFRPLQVALTDEGVNGLAIHLINDGAQLRQCNVTLAAWHRATTVISATRALELKAHSARELSSAELLERFFDITYAYRFGPPAHDVTVVSLSDATTHELLAEAFHFPHGYDIQPQALEWRVQLEQDAQHWYLKLQCNRLATSVQIVDEQFWPEDNWFHLAANTERRIRLLPRGESHALPDGEVRSLNSEHTVRYRGTA